jgi:hypothetical protein
MTPNRNTAHLDFDLQHNDQEITNDSELTTSAPLLEPRQQHDQHTTETQKNAHSVHETVGSPTPDSGLSDSKRLEKQLELPQGWPTLPQPVNVRISSLVWEILVDIILLVLSASFLAFALCVISYNRKPTSLHQQAAERLAQASQWVSAQANYASGLFAYHHRDPRYIPYSSLPSLDELPTRSYFGDSRKAR